MAAMTFFVRKRDQIRYSLMGVACLLIMGMIDYLGFFNGMDSHVYDLFFRLRGPAEISEQLVIAAVDEKTLDKFGRWPIARKYYSTFLNRVGNASAVVFDIILAEPSAGDLGLADAITDSRAIVLPVYIDHRQHLVLPGPSLRQAALGHVHLEPGVDGVLRDIYHTLTHDGKQLPSISSVAYDLVNSSPSAREQLHLQVADPVPPNTNSIIQQDRMGINFYGPRGTFPYLSFSDIIENKFPETFFDNKIILLGLTAAGIDQDHLTTFSYDRNRMPGVEVQAHILNNLIDGTDIKPVNEWIRWAGVVLVFLFGVLIFIRIGSKRAVMVWAALFVGLSVMVFYLLSGAHIWLPPVILYVALTAALVMAYIFNLERMGALLLQAKKDWESSFNSITDAIIIQDQSGKTILSNRSADDGPREFFDRYFKQHAKPSLTSSSMTPSLFDDKENRAEIFDESLNRHFEVHRFPREDENKHKNGMVHVIRDITERKNLIEEQMNLQAQLIQSQKLEAIGTLASGIAHDFNNILSAIMGYTQLAEVLIPSDSKARAKLEEVLKACNRAANLVMQILSFSRQTEQKKIPVMLRPIVKEVLKLLKATLPPTIEIKADVTGKQKVKGDPSQFYQVILNLCTNASYALAGGPGQIIVTLESTDIDSHTKVDNFEIQKGRYVKISISDTGCGIQDDIKKRIFDPYFTTKAKDAGTGLGLATAHGIVKNHGGFIQFESQENIGTTFHVYLPQVETQPKRMVFDGRRAPGTAHGRLLLIDDQEALVETGQKLLENLGYTVIAKNCPQQALEIFQKNPDEFDLVITDLAMKKMTGVTLTEKILAIRKDIPVILCTGYHDEVTKETALKTGVLSFVNKPFSIDKLADKIQQLLNENK